jgi:transcription antitermination factor NusG
MVADSPGKWWAVQTRPQYERHVRDELNRLKQFVFLPLETVRVIYKSTRGTKHYDRPLFPSYLFYNGDHAAAYECEWVNRVMHTDERDRRDIEDLMLACQTGPVSPAGRLLVGIAGEIIAGPLRGIRGEVIRVNERSVLILPLHILQAASLIEIDPAAFQPDSATTFDRLRSRQQQRRRTLQSAGKVI